MTGHPARYVAGGDRTGEVTGHPARYVAGGDRTGALVLLVFAVKFFASWTRAEMQRPEDAAADAQRRVAEMQREADAVVQETRDLAEECRRLVEEADHRAMAGDREGAKELLRKAIGVLPGEGWEDTAQGRLGNLLRDEGRTDEAAACYERACAITPRSAENWFDLGRLREGQGRLDDAIECFARAEVGWTSDPALKRVIAEALVAAKGRREGR